LTNENQNSQICPDAFDIYRFKDSLNGKNNECYVCLEVADCKSSVRQSGDEEECVDSLTNPRMFLEENLGMWEGMWRNWQWRSIYLS